MSKIWWWNVLLPNQTQQIINIIMTPYEKYLEQIENLSPEEKVEMEERSMNWNLRLKNGEICYIHGEVCECSKKEKLKTYKDIQGL